MIRAFASLLNTVFDLILLPFGALSPVWGLLFVSVLSGLGMIAVFGRVSDQRRISALRRRMGGEILGILLHAGSPRTAMRFAFRLIWSNTLYLAYLLVPLLVLALPFMLVWGQLEARYGAEGLPVGRPVTVTLHYDGGLPDREEIRPAGYGLEIVDPLVLVDTLDQASFRVRSLDGAPAAFDMEGTSVPVGRKASRSGARVLRGFSTRASIRSIFVPHVHLIRDAGGIADEGWYSLPEVRYLILGHWSWAAVFLVFSMLSAVVGAKFLGIRV